ncbi:MAG TPA: asparagine synthase (glutamine-hydrolyzing) [Proteobacteria bacterium]|nr:asparagine synthase (glutamine-hydrolyzing) [Pseudomonadota bacterium]
MCGIGGIFSRGGLGPDHEGVLENMKASLAHRGPDGSGVWTDAAAGIGLCHTRLAVLDLTPMGNQPMRDLSGRGAISYNGEVYNHRELRSELEGTGWRFRSQTDTEVVLAGCLTWGIPRALERFNGMFAFAFWDASERALYLVRDRIGIKPLYYGWAGDDLIFGSELKALCVHPGFTRTVDHRALELFLMLQYIPSPRTIYTDAFKLPPGHFMRLDPDGKTSVAQWWNPDRFETKGETTGSESLEPELSALLDDSVRDRLMSDVPLGAFLSGGMDSGIVVAAMAGTGGSPPSTFTVSYQEDDFDEGPVAADVAGHLGTAHHQVKINSRTLLDRVFDLPLIFDEPLSDPSALPMIVLSRLAREHVSVILSGDGGDELFGGYDRYRAVDRYINRFVGLSPSMRRSAAAVMARLPSRPLTRSYNLLKKISGRVPVENFAGKWEKLLKLIVQNDPSAAYQASIGIFSPTEAGEVLGKQQVPLLPDTFNSFLNEPSDKSFVRRMMELDARTFLTDDVLAKVDRASMAVGLEVRVPLLDHRIVQWSRRVNDEDLFEKGKGKAPLRQLARRYLPEDILRRPKMGFTMPLDSWLRGELKDLLTQYLGAGSRVLENYFDPPYVNQLVREHLTGQSNHHEKLWNLLVFALWEERWKPMAA